MMTNNKYLTNSDYMRKRLSEDKILPLIGVYDVFSACLTTDYFDGIFCSGYSFAASYFGLPDNGHMTWSDLVSYVLRMRSILPDKHILVDIDDGFGDEQIATDVITKLEIAGASAVMMEDQRRPKKCGHLGGKEIVPLEEFILKLEKVILSRKDMFVLARTDATELNEGIKRIKAFVQTGVDAVMVEGLNDRDSIDKVCNAVPGTTVCVNLIYGGKTPPITMSQLQEHGVKMVLYSTPCLFAAQLAITKILNQLKEDDGLISEKLDQVSLVENNAFLNRMLENKLNL